jgi:hypothetical protein
MINVQLEEGGPITQMDEAFLYRRTVTLDDDHEHTVATEYFHLHDKPLLNAGQFVRAIHRSVHVHLKQGVGIEGVLGKVG